MELWSEEVARVRQEGRQEGIQEGRELWSEEVARVRQEGRQEGREEGKLEVARKLLAAGISSDEVKKYVGLTIA